MAWGGERTPANPAVVSGPGAHSARTDGGVMDPDAPGYGEGVELQNLQQAGAAAIAGAPPGGGGGGGDPLAGVVPLGAPPSMGVPVTAGAAAGEGPGPEALGLPTDRRSEDKADAAALDPALINAMFAKATDPSATPSFKRRVRELFAAM